MTAVKKTVEELGGWPQSFKDDFHFNSDWRWRFERYSIPWRWCRDGKQVRRRAGIEVPVIISELFYALWRKENLPVILKGQVEFSQPSGVFESWLDRDVNEIAAFITARRLLEAA